MRISYAPLVEKLKGSGRRRGCASASPGSSVISEDKEKPVTRGRAQGSLGSPAALLGVAGEAWTFLNHVGVGGRASCSGKGGRCYLHHLCTGSSSAPQRDSCSCCHGSPHRRTSCTSGSLGRSTSGGRRPGRDPPPGAQHRILGGKRWIREPPGGKRTVQGPGKEGSLLPLKPGLFS